MTGASSEGSAAPADGAAKKDLSVDDLKVYIRKQKAKIRKLEEQSKASAVDAGETEHTTHEIRNTKHEKSRHGTRAGLGLLGACPCSRVYLPGA